MGLKEIRKAKGITQDELSEMCGVPKMTLSKIERGVAKIENVSFINAIKIADALCIDPHELIGE